MKIIRKEDAINRIIAASYSVDNLLTSEDSSQMSVAVSTATDHVETTTTLSDRVYYIIEGELVIDGETAFTGDVVYIPKNTTYKFSGTFKAVLINSPPFNKQKEDSVQKTKI